MALVALTLVNAVCRPQPAIGIGRVSVGDRDITRRQPVDDPCQKDQCQAIGRRAPIDGGTVESALTRVRVNLLPTNERYYTSPQQPDSNGALISAGREQGTQVSLTAKSPRLFADLDVEQFLMVPAHAKYTYSIGISNVISRTLEKLRAKRRQNDGPHTRGSTEIDTDQRSAGLPR
jgi:hypothetical protein